jgi:hypothetical protein
MAMMSKKKKKYVCYVVIMINFFSWYKKSYTYANSYTCVAAP